jgi:hypothetical protein
VLADGIVCRAGSAEGAMSRRTFLKGMGAGTVAAGLGSARPAAAFVPAHNWDRHDWGTAPPVRDRLNQGPFPQYAPEEVLPGSDVVMATTPSDQVVPGYGKGLVTYVTGDFGGATFAGVDAAKAIEAFAEIPMGSSSTYGRPGESCRSGGDGWIPTSTGRWCSRWRRSAASGSGSG